MPTSSRTSRPTRSRILGPISCVGKIKDGGTVTVCGVDSPVFEGKDLRLRKHSIRGVFNNYTALIGLDIQLSEPQKETTLLHEIIHAVDDQLDIGLTEEQVTLLSAGLYSVQFKGPKKRDKVRTIKGVFYG